MYGSRRRLFLSFLFFTMMGAPGVANAAVLVVPSVYPTIQAAIDAAADGDKVLVGAGIYHESVVWTGKAIELAGVGVNGTIIDPVLAGRCLWMIDVPFPGRVHDITCQRGYAHEETGSKDGGGALIQGGSPRFSRVVFRWNGADSCGAGLWVEGARVSVRDAVFFSNTLDFAGVGAGMGVTNGGFIDVANTLFVDNIASLFHGGGLAVIEGSHAAVRKSRFESNMSQFGGGIYSNESVVDVGLSVLRHNGSHALGSALGAKNSSVRVFDSSFDENQSFARRKHVVSVDGDLRIHRSTITKNDGGGIFSTGNLDVESCVFSGNATASGGAIFAKGDARVTNSLFFANIADGEGGLSASPPSGGAIESNGTLQVSACTFHGNKAKGPIPPGQGGALNVPSGSATVINSIFWGNLPNEIEGAVTVSHSDVQGGFPGTGNIDQDPQFVDMGAFDLRLAPCSPARDAGVLFGGMPATDLIGNPRVVDLAPDMGAYEITTACVAYTGL